MSNVSIGIMTQKAPLMAELFLADKLVYLVNLVYLANLANLVNLVYLVNLR